nr:GyrI-like domain-containing protein [Chakrabartyella piscis]
MEQFFLSTCELEVMVPVIATDVKYCNALRTFGGYNAVIAYHVGSYENISATHLRLLKWIADNNLKLAGHISEEYIISPIDLQSSQSYITKIIAPIH